MLRLHAFQDSFVVEPSRQSSAASVLTMTRTNPQQINTSVSESINALDLSKAQSMTIYGIIGTIKLLRGHYLIVATQATPVVRVMETTIYNLQASVLIPFSTKAVDTDLPLPRQQKDEIHYLNMLQAILNNGLFYFSHDYDLTHTTQRIAAIAADPVLSKQSICERADERFFYNRFLAKEFLDRKLFDWALPLVSGNVVADTFKAQNRQIDFILISRRGWKRTGYRYTCRGLDTNGNAANYAETEQILIVEGTAAEPKPKLLSFNQTRGSIPLLWAQTPDLKYNPKPYVIDAADFAQSHVAYTKHFDEQREFYGRQILINLINHTKSEGVMEKAFRKQVETAAVPDVRFVSFDFHKECKGMKYENLSKLLDSVSDEVGSMGYFMAEYEPLSAGGNSRQSASSSSSSSAAPIVGHRLSVLRRQQGCFRTNCMDCLDRTNVVQNLFAEQALENQLKDLGLVSEQILRAHKEHTEQVAEQTKQALAAGKKKPKFNPILNSLLGRIDTQFAFRYKGVWADNADRMSILYSGTGALKTDFTRLGKRTAKGAIQDGINSLTRYYLNNFCDGHKQDELDLFHGRFVPSRDESPFHRNGGSSFLKFFVQLALVLGALFGAFAYSAPAEYVPSACTLVSAFVVTQLVVAWQTVKRFGRRFANKPRFVPTKH